MKTQEINSILKIQSDKIIDSMNTYLETINTVRKNSYSFEIMDYDFENKYFILENNTDITVENDIVDCDIIEKNTELHIYTYYNTYFNQSFDNTSDFIIIDNIMFPSRMAFYKIFKKELKNAALILDVDYKLVMNVFNKYSKEITLFCLNLRRNKKYSSFLKLMLMLVDRERNFIKYNNNNVASVYYEKIFNLEFKELLELI